MDVSYRCIYISCMTKADVVAHFETQARVAKALGIRQSSVAVWGEYPPLLRQYQIEVLTQGLLKAERSGESGPISA